MSIESLNGFKNLKIQDIINSNSDSKSSKSPIQVHFLYIFSDGWLVGWTDRVVVGRGATLYDFGHEFLPLFYWQLKNKCKD